MGFTFYHQILLTVCFTDANLGYSKEHIGFSEALALGYSITKRTILCSTAGIWFIKIGYNMDPYEISEYCDTQVRNCICCWLQ